jgi:hypothetical protein
MRYLKLFENFQEVDNPHGGEFNYGKLSQYDITKVNDFIEDLKIYTKEHDVNLNLSPEKGVQFSEDGVICNGYFDGDDTRTLACALGKDVSQWLIILLHESCHMDQWVEKVPEWTENAGMDNIEKWLNGDDSVNMNNIDNEIKTSMIVEIDCEKRTVEKIKKYGLDSVINIDKYIQKSNAYILFYLWLRKNRKWYTVGKEPYNIPEVVSVMPKTFDMDYTILDIKIEKIYDTYL